MRIQSFQDGKIETVFKVAPPLEKLDKGFFGYKGIILRNTLTDKLQCHMCGKWFKGLNIHIFRKHKIKAKNYKRLFGLPLSYGLVSRSTSTKMSKNGQANVKYLKGKRNPTKAGNSKTWENDYMRKSKSFLNQHGACNEQIERRFLIVADIIGKEPSQEDLIKYDHSLWTIIRRRFKNLNTFRKKMGYSIRKRSKLFTDDQLLAHLRKVYKKSRAIPSPKNFRKGSPNAETIRNHFGSWAKALSLAGIS